MRVRLKDIALKLNLSESTVSRALANNPKISDETKKRVYEVSKKLNYRPNLIAKSLKLKQTKTIGLIIDDITNPFYPEIVKGSEEVANQKGINIILCNSDYDPIKESKYINILLDKRVDGMLLMPIGKKIPIIKLLNEEKTPFVFIDIKPSERINVNCVYTDQNEGAYLATKYLIQLGHSKIALINGPDSFSSCQQLKSGFLKALKESKIEINPEYLKVCNLKSSGGYQSVKKLLKLKKAERPTAALFISDITAVAAYNAVKEEGLKVPDNFSIIGNDDIKTSENFSPPLTTIAHPKYEMGKKSMELLINEINNKRNINMKTIKFVHELKIRKSAAPTNVKYTI